MTIRAGTSRNIVHFPNTQNNEVQKYKLTKTPPISTISPTIHTWGCTASFLLTGQVMIGLPSVLLVTNGHGRSRAAIINDEVLVCLTPHLPPKRKRPTSPSISLILYLSSQILWNNDRRCQPSLSTQLPMPLMVLYKLFALGR